MMPRSRYAQLQGREVHYMEWGAPGAQPLVMWHGLARTGRDFDWIAGRLADRFHIICPDTVGRGLSEWSDNPDSDLLLPEIADEMTQRGPKAQVVDVEGCGHAPGLVQDPHIELVAGWLTA